MTLTRILLCVLFIAALAAPSRASETSINAKHLTDRTIKIVGPDPTRAERIDLARTILVYCEELLRAVPEPPSETQWLKGGPSVKFAFIGHELAHHLIVKKLTTCQAQSSKLLGPMTSPKAEAYSWILLLLALNEDQTLHEYFVRSGLISADPERDVYQFSLLFSVRQFLLLKVIAPLVLHEQ